MPNYGPSYSTPLILKRKPFLVCPPGVKVLIFLANINITGEKNPPLDVQQTLLSHFCSEGANVRGDLLMMVLLREFCSVSLTLGVPVM